MFFENAEVTIIRSDRKTLAIQLKNGEIVARAPKGMTDDEIYTFINAKRTWIETHLAVQQQRKERLKTLRPFTQDDISAMSHMALLIIPKKVAFYAQKIGVTYNRITIRCQRTRWGSCSSQGNLNFNCLLMLLPEEIVDSVIVHELCHRKHMNHSKQFYAEIKKVFPDYDRCHRWLNENGRIFLDRLP